MEIEKKYLADKFPFELTNFPCHEIEQAYISTNPAIRIRKSDENYYLTVKGEGALAREEFEMNINGQQYHHLIQKTEGNIIYKKRFLVPLENNLVAEIDIYEKNLYGLITVEVEFTSLEQAEAFIPPNWFGKDVTMDYRYKNSQLSLYGIPDTH